VIPPPPSAALAVVAACALAVPLFGWAVARRIPAGDYLSAGRRVSLPAFVATLVCTWYGGILGVGEYAWSWGLVNWLALGAFYYLFAGLYAVFLAGRVRASSALSIPEQIAFAHGPAAGRVAAVYALLMVSPAPYLLMTALLLSVILGTGFLPALLLAVGLTVAYVWRGGLPAVIATDLLQFGLMFAAFASTLVWLVLEHGGLAFLQAELPAAHLQIPGDLGWSSVLLWGFVALWTLVDPGFHQRVGVARDTRTARRGIWLAIGCWFVFDGLTTACGLYARALLPQLGQPALAYPALAGLLPPLLQGLFLGGLLAVVLSTLDSFCFLSGSTVVRDLLGRRGGVDERRLLRQGILWTTLAAALLAWSLRSVVQMWITIASLGIPVLLPVLLSSFGRTSSPSRHSPAGLVSMLAGGALSLVWLLAGWAQAQDGWPRYPLGLEPIYPGLAASALPLLAARLMRRR
jgi:solute:Na+ symporter, SSS family